MDLSQQASITIYHSFPQPGFTSTNYTSFHYQNRNELYGVLSLENQFVYDIYRTRNNVILMGIKDILCYNVEGELQWSIPHESEGI